MYKINQLIQLSIELGQLKAFNDAISFSDFEDEINKLEQKIERLKSELLKGKECTKT